MRSLPTLLLACSIAAAGCTASTSDDLPEVTTASTPLINGDVVQSDPAVVALLLSNGFLFCTGTLVSPSIIATAAHCMDDAGDDPAIAAFFGNDVNSDGRRVAVSLAKAHIGWESDPRPANDKLGRYDIALMRLEFPQDPALPVPLYTGSINVGDTVRRLGFGGNNPQGDIDGKKRSGLTNVLRRCDQGTCSWSADSDAYETGGTEVSTCGGDSGGPAFYTDTDGTEYLVSVHSYGPRNGAGECLSGSDGSTRVEPYLDSWVLPFIQDNDPVCGMDQVCGYIGCTNDPDCTPCGPNGECVTDCALPDPDCTTQELGEICQKDTQCISGTCIFYPGDREYHFCSEECDPGADTCPAGMECQTVAGKNYCNFVDDPPGILGDSCEQATDCGSYVCEQNTCVYSCNIAAGRGCPEGFECSSVDGNQNYYCHAVDSGGGGGCSTGGSQAGVLLLLGVMALMWRRRRS